MKRIGLYVVAVILVVAGQVYARPENIIIVPGHAIGDITLGMSQGMVFNRLGMPDEISNVRNGDGSMDIYWTYVQEEGRSLVVSWTRKDGQVNGVDYLFTDSGRYLTSKGVRIGDSRFPQLWERYGAPDRLLPSRMQVMFIYDSIGVRFRVDAESGVVVAIAITIRKP